MRRRTPNSMVALLAALVVLLAGVPAAATSPTPVGDDLTVTRDRLRGAERELSEVEAAVRRANDEVAAIDDRLRLASTSLVALRTRLVEAEHARDAAVAAERTAAADLGEADTRLSAAVDAFDGHRERLQQRAVVAFKHGSAAPQDVLVRGVAAAGDWHEVAVTLETVGRLVADDRALIDDSRELTRTTAGLRAEVGGARATAVAAARTAAEQERAVAELVTEQERVVAEVARERLARADVLRRLEQDAAARAVLVRDLEDRVRELERAALLALRPVVVDLPLDGPGPDWSARLPAGGQPWAATIDAVAARHGIDGRLLAALVWTESNFRPDAVSHAGALGLAQLMPGTARGLRVDPHDPVQNLEGGARYLRAQLDTFGRVDLALAAYNAGPGRVRAVGRVPDIVETQLYVVRVLDRYQALGG